jgi:hypothetical protein
MNEWEDLEMHEIEVRKDVADRLIARCAAGRSDI